ncbi:hypothetical protein WR25_19916 [Diploscapter pachys]|uniref:U6 snRNA-associated Sm-like protein LSm2 n=1 Tax=Diploscapter pachys TaxID=2018661 RepID=A0A2A2LXP5_9BILA|nr:hypothetical protein WR25_19916 [Diploscapter pachys]
MSRENVTLPALQTVPIAPRKPPVYYINDEFVLFDEQDVLLARENLRVVCEPMNTSNSDQFISSWCMPPETAATLLQYDLIEVYRPKDTDSLSFDVDASIYSIIEPAKEEEKKWAKAKWMAQKTKMKEIRKRMRDEATDGLPNKVRKIDLSTVEVTEEEIQAASEKLNEISSKLKGKDKKKFPGDNSTPNLGSIRLPPVYFSDDLYEPICLSDLPLPSTEKFRNRRVVWHDLWRRGFYLTTGSRFGCDLMVYEAQPGTVHAAYLCQIAASTDCVSVSSLSALSRLSTQVKKIGLLAIAALDSHTPYYLKFGLNLQEAKFEMLFFSFFKSMVGKDVVVELKNDLSICGTLHSVDQYLNMKLTDITVSDPDRFPHMLSVKNCFIRGSVVRYVQLPADQVDTQLLQDAARKEIAQSKKA